MKYVWAWSFLSILLLASSASAQAWTRDQGSGYVNLNYRLIAADEIYDPDGNERSIPDYKQHAIGIYGEVGVIDRYLTLTFDGELYRRNVLEDMGATQGLGDLRVGAWTGVLTAPFRLALGVQLGLPTGDDSPSVDDPAANLIAASLPTGDGEYDVTFRSAIGHSFTAGSLFGFYVQGNLGYALRTKGFTDQIVYGAEFGTRITKPVIDRFLLILRLVGTESLDTGAAISGFAGLGDGVSFTSYGVELAARVWSTFHLSAGVESAFRGANVPSAPAYKFAASYEF